MCRYSDWWFAITPEGFLNVNVKLLVWYSWIRYRTMLTGYKVLILCYQWSWSTELIVGDRKQEKPLLPWCHLKSKICNEEDIDITAYMLVWTKKKFYLNIQTYLKINRLSLYYYVAATQLKVLLYNYCTLYGCAIAEYIVIKVNMLNYLWDLSKHAAAYANYLCYYDVLWSRSLSWRCVLCHSRL